jgi:hypothetical protein
MRLLTQALEKQIPGLYTTERVPILEKVAWAKLFHPATSWSWYVLEYDGRDTCFGLVVGLETELGYFSLRELRSSEYFGLQVERDKLFQPTQLQDLPVYDIERVAA